MKSKRLILALTAGVAVLLLGGMLMGTTFVVSLNEIEGTDSADEIKGTGGDDSISGLGGSDTIEGGEGDDRLFGAAFGAVANTLPEQWGDGDVAWDEGGMERGMYMGDTYRTAEGGDDVIRGEEGDDEIVGDIGADELRGGPGDDVLVEGPGGDEAEDHIYADEGNDFIESVGDPGSRDIVRCGPGTDEVQADSEDDVGDDCENVEVLPSIYSSERPPEGVPRFLPIPKEESKTIR